MKVSSPERPFLAKLNSRSFLVVVSLLALSWIAFFLGKLSERGLIQLVIFLTGFFLSYKGVKCRMLDRS